MDNQECGLCFETYTHPPFNLQKDQYKELNLSELYYYVTKLPTIYPLDILICNSCCGKLITSYEFIEMCLQSNQRLPQVKSEDYTEDVDAQEDIVQINTVDRDPDDDATEMKMGFSRKRVSVVPNYRSSKRKKNVEKTIIQPKSEPDEFDMIPSENLVYWGAKDTDDSTDGDKDPPCEPPPLDSIATFTTAKQYSEPFSLNPVIDVDDVDVKHFICSKCFTTFWSMEELELHAATHT